MPSVFSRGEFAALQFDFVLPLGDSAVLVALFSAERFSASCLPASQLVEQAYTVRLRSKTGASSV